MPWITNGEVAWEIPGDRIARLFINKVYTAPEGWGITMKIEAGRNAWTKGDCGELRRRVANAS